MVSTSVAFAGSDANDRDIAEQFDQAEAAMALNTQKGKDEAIAIYQQLAQTHSGLAYMRLASLNDDNPKKAIKDWLSAAQYGYPQKAYLAIAAIYDQGGNGLKKDGFIAQCYRNLAKPIVAQDMLTMCEQNTSMFTYYPNQGIQNTYEAMIKARSDYQALCQRSDLSVLNRDYSKAEAKELQSLLCSDDVAQSSLKDNDLVLVDQKLYQIKSGMYVPYQAPLNTGEVVYRFIDPKQVYVFDGKQLTLAQEGMKIIKAGQSYIFHDNHFSKEVIKPELSDEDV